MIRGMLLVPLALLLGAAIAAAAEAGTGKQIQPAGSFDTREQAFRRGPFSAIGGSRSSGSSGSRSSGFGGSGSSGFGGSGLSGFGGSGSSGFSGSGSSGFGGSGSSGFGGSGLSGFGSGSSDFGSSDF